MTSTVKKLQNQDNTKINSLDNKIEKNNSNMADLTSKFEDLQDQNKSKINSLDDKQEQNNTNLATLTSTVKDLQELLAQSILLNQNSHTIQTVTTPPPSGQETFSNDSNIEHIENLNSVVNIQIEDAVMASPSHSNITIKKNIISNYQFAVSEQALSRSWDNCTIMAIKNEVIIQQNDINGEDLSSDANKDEVKRTRPDT